ncbi:MAG: Hpt domain-containing protein, partial [Candidatus Competibacteraceae bacterium]|nr:Hpt domain-containing protein [Candidatus Competibacteraceae bacterium]
RRIHLDLDAYEENSTESGLLEMLVDAVEQVRSPLLALEHREAVTLLDEMRTATLERVKDASTPLDLPLLRRATERLTDYLEAYLSPGSRQANSGLLVETVAALRQARQHRLPQDNPPASSQDDSLESSMDLYDVRDILARLQQTVTDKLEPAADQPASWEALRDDLSLLHQLFIERNWPRATDVLDRLNRIVVVLANGAAEHYGLLVNDVCAEILVGFSYSLESLMQDAPGSAAILNNAQAQLTQLDTLLRLPTDLQAPLPSALQPRTVETPGAPEPLTSLPELDVNLPGLPESVVDATESQSQPTFDIQLVDLDLSMELSAIDAESNNGHGKTDEASVEDLINLIGLADTDPEFVEVFLEEARGELEAIRKQLGLWRADLTDHQPLTTIRRAFHTLKGSGRMVNAIVIGDFAWELENLLNHVLDGSLAVSLEIVDATAAAVGILAPLVGEIPLGGDELDALAALATRVKALARVEPAVARPAPIPTPAEPVSRKIPSVRVIAPEIDPEFIEVFLEEARGELEAIRRQLPAWQKNLEDRQVLTTLRRAFHTLKGSGRVVGATMLGDFAWCFENLLNHVINGTQIATPAMIELFEEAVAALEALVGEATVADEALLLLPGLTTRAEALMKELPVSAPVAALPETEKAEEQPSAAVIPAPAAVSPPTPEVAPPVPVVIPPPTVSEAPPPVEISPPPEAPTPTPEPAAAVDLELARVFQYEATEILDASDAILQQLSDEPDNTILLNNLRRGMHTLKG